MRTGGREEAIVVERAESALVVRSAGTDAAAVGFAAALPAEPERTTVVVDASAAGALHALDDRLLARLRDLLYAEPPRRWEMRLVAARTGRADASGAPPLAARLAERLGMGVVAPDGELVVLRGGELFSAGPGAGWLGFRQGRDPEWSGPRYPAPAWQAALPRELRSPKPRPLSRLRGRDRGASSVTVTAIPAGFWVRMAGAPPMPLVDLGYGVPVEPARPIVLVGAPGEQPPGVAELAAFFASLPPALRDVAVLVPYGRHPAACAALAQSLADRLETVVRAYHALPHYAMDGTRKFAVFDARGTADRLTATPENVYSPSPASSPAPSRATPRDGEDAFDGDPVASDTPPHAPTQPVPELARTGAPPSGLLGATASVTVDAEGRMRPAVPASRRAHPARPGPGPRRAETAAGGGGEHRTTTAPAARVPTAGVAGDVAAAERTAPAASVLAASVPAVTTAAATTAAATTAAATTSAMAEGTVPSGRAPSEPASVESPSAAPGPGEAPPVRTTPAESAPTAFRTTASTVLPRTRSAPRAAPPREQQASPADPETRSDPGRRPAEPATPGTPYPETRTVHHDDRAVRQDEWAVGRDDRAVTDAPLVAEEHALAPGSSAAGPRETPAPVPDVDSATVTPAPSERIFAYAAPHAGEDARVFEPVSPVPATGVDPVPAMDAGPAIAAADPRPSPGTSPDLPPPAVPRSRDYDRLWLANRASTPQERQEFRASLGWRYDAAARSVTRLLAEHPGLRSAGPPDEGLMTELAAVRVFAGRDQAATVEALRIGEEADRAFAACVAGGLQRLPALQGVVVRGGPPDPGAADAYREGEELIEAAPLIALDDLGAAVPGGVELLIWSVTARRLTGFAADRAGCEVAFLPGTVFRVLAVDPPPATARVRRVLLTEVPPAKAGPGHAEWAERIRARLVKAAESRPATSPDEYDEPDDRFAPLPGDPVPDARRSRP